MTLGALLVGGVIVLVLALNAYFAGPKSRKVPPASTLPPELRERLGTPLATWLETTRRLRSELVTLEDHALDMLAQERERAGRTRNLRRQVQDASFLQRVRDVRDLAAGWRRAAEELEAEDVRRLERLEIEVRGVAEGLSLPWGISEEDDFRRDRSDEIETVLGQCKSAGPQLARIDAVLTAPEREGARAFSRNRPVGRFRVGVRSSGISGGGEVR